MFPSHVRVSSLIRYFTAALSVYISIYTSLHRQVPHWCNLTFAAASRPRRAPDASNKSAPSGLASTDPPAGEGANAVGDKPVYMPRLVDPGPFTRNLDGSIDMRSLCMPTVLAVLTGHKAVGKVGEQPAPSGGDNNDDDDDNDERDDQERPPFHLEPWSVVERMYPQPEPGPEGAFEVARRLAALRARLKASSSPPPSLPSDPTPPVDPCATSHAERRVTSPTRVVASGLMTPETLGTSPGAAYCGSPRSLGRQTTVIQHVSRPWPDKDSFVGATAQPTLRGSPRGPGTAGGGFGGGRGGGKGDAVAAPPWRSAVRPRGRRRAFLQRMSDDEWKLMKPKFAAYDEQVNKVPALLVSGF